MPHSNDDLEPVEQIAARLVQELQEKRPGRRLRIEAIRAHLFGRVGPTEAGRQKAYQLIEEAEHAYLLLNPKTS